MASVVLASSQSIPSEHGVHSGPPTLSLRADSYVPSLQRHARALVPPPREPSAHGWHAARLFARQCPLLHTANDRRKFTSALLTHADAPDVLGAGLPGAIVASAFSASRADLERILSRATASPPPGGASSSSPFTPIRGGGLSSGFSTPGGE